MMRGTTHTHSLRRGLVAVSVAGGIVMMLVAFTIAFSNAASAREIAQSSQELQWANATSGVSAVSRAAVNQALVFSVDHAIGVATADVAAKAIDEAYGSLAATESFAIDAPDNSGALPEEVRNLIEIGRNALAHMERGAVAEADATLQREFEPAYAVLADALRAQQVEQAERIDRAQSSAARTENITRLIVTLLIPGAAIVIHQLIVRRQYREREVVMAAQLEAERELNRSKDEFIAGISHELRTPLTTIYGFSDHLLEMGLADPTESLELITMINDDSAELSRMVDDLLAAARIDAGAVSYEIAPLELISETELLVNQFRRSGAKLDVLGDRTVALADRSRLRQILRNLISNAQRHGGPRIELDVSRSKNQAAVRVIDDGDGVPQDMEPRLFTRFVHESTDTLTSGSVGLGLAIARQMSQDMGGDITYERTLGLTIFTLYLPLAPTDSVPIPTTQIPDVRIHPHAQSSAESVDRGGAELVVSFE